MKNNNIIETIAKALDDIFNETPSMDRERPYTGQPHTCTGERGKQLVEGLTMRDIRDCFIRAYIVSHEYTPKNAPYIDEANKGVDACLCANDVFELEGNIDPIAVSQNLGCEIEKAIDPKIF